MTLIDSLTPENTEEVKPGIFVQKHSGSYRVVKPLAWDGKLLIKHQLKTVFNLRTIFTIVLIIFIAWSYMAETEYSRKLQNNPCDLLQNITEYCYSDINYQRTLGDNEFKWDDFTIQGNP